MKSEFINFVANYAEAIDEKLIIQTATGTYAGTPIFREAETNDVNKMISSFEIERNTELQAPYIALENVTHFETGKTLSSLIFFEESILAISRGNLY